MNRLRELLAGEGTTCLLGVHDAMSAVIAERAGVEALWASSFTMSCANGYQDNNEMSTFQVLDRIETMARRVSVPILLDADTGYGSSERLTVFAEAFHRRGGAGLCIEDKRFPKRNSLSANGSQRLEEVDRFCGRLEAVRRCRGGRELVVVARTEALILRETLAEALGRCSAYVDAGADAVLVHSKADTVNEVAGFMAEWGRRAPVLCVPTTYAKTPWSVFVELGVSGVIWANHMLRACADVMTELADRVVRMSHVDGFETLSTVGALFALQRPVTAPMTRQQP